MKMNTTGSGIIVSTLHISDSIYVAVQLLLRLLPFGSVVDKAFPRTGAFSFMLWGAGPKNSNFFRFSFVIKVHDINYIFQGAWSHDIISFWEFWFRYVTQSRNNFYFANHFANYFKALRCHEDSENERTLHFIFGPSLLKYMFRNSNRFNWDFLPSAFCRSNSLA